MTHNIPTPGPYVVSGEKEYCVIHGPTVESDDYAVQDSTTGGRRKIPRSDIDYVYSLDVSADWKGVAVDVQIFYQGRYYVVTYDSKVREMRGEGGWEKPYGETNPAVPGYARWVSGDELTNVTSTRGPMRRVAGSGHA